jgi:sulfopyruvate decarboxylase TPP-binding subunit
MGLSPSPGRFRNDLKPFSIGDLRLRPSGNDVDCDAFQQALRAAGVTHIVGLPDTTTAPLFDGSHAAPPRSVAVCREGEPFGIAAGLWAGGAQPLVLIQSTGLFEAGDALRNFAFELEVPLDLVVGYRGYGGQVNAGCPDTARQFLEPVLRAWGLEYSLLDATDDYAGFADALRAAARRPNGTRVWLLPE